MLKELFRQLVKQIGWKRALLWMWEACDDSIKKYTDETPNKVDDEAFHFVDVGIRTITKE